MKTNVHPFGNWLVGQAVILLLLTLLFATSATAAPSAGCNAINAAYGGGATFSARSEKFLDNLVMSPGETINYSVSTSGSQNSTDNGGAGFAIYDNSDGYGMVVSDTYAKSGAELQLNSSYTIPATAKNYYTVYVWSGEHGATASATISCAAASNPSITTSPSALSTSAGGNASFTVVAANATGYQWQENSGSGYTNISNGGVYSGATTATLTITGATTGMNGYLYRVVATGSVSPTATSNAASLTIQQPSAPFVFTPAAGNLKEAMAGEEYNQTISVSGGSGTLAYYVLSGDMPDGITLSTSTGELSGSVDAAAAIRDYTFTLRVEDQQGAHEEAIYTIKVIERAVGVTNKDITVQPGSAPRNVSLTDGATGGPFVSADIVTISPSTAGKFTIVNGEFAQAGPVGPLGWYLKFIPDPAYSGQVSVRFRLTSALGTSNTGIVTYLIGYDAASVAAEIDSLVGGFVQSRQNMISSTIKIPGLLERREMATSTSPVTTTISPSENGMTMNFSTSLAQMEAASNKADGQNNINLSPFNVWIDGTFLLHNRDQNGNKWGNFAMVSAGVDYMLSDSALFGMSFHFDRMTDPTDQDAELTGNGWLAGPYASLEIGTGVFWDTSLLYGGSANDIDTRFWDGSFDTKRLLFDTAVKGKWDIDDVTVLKPKLRLVYFSETIEDYSVKNNVGDQIELGGFTTEQFRVSLGAEIARKFTLENETKITPTLGFTGGFAGMDGSGAFGQISAGLSVETIDEWALDFSLLYNLQDENGKSAGARAGVKKTF